MILIFNFGLYSDINIYVHAYMWTWLNIANTQGKKLKSHRKRPVWLLYFDSIRRLIVPPGLIL